MNFLQSKFGLFLLRNLTERGSISQEWSHVTHICEKMDALKPNGNVSFYIQKSATCPGIFRWHNQHILFLEINYMRSNLLATSTYLILFIECLWYAKYYTRLINISFNEVISLKHLAHACSILHAPYLLAGVISTTTYPPQLILGAR